MPTTEVFSAHTVAMIAIVAGAIIGPALLTLPYLTTFKTSDRTKKALRIVGALYLIAFIAFYISFQITG